VSDEMKTTTETTSRGNGNGPFSTTRRRFLTGAGIGVAAGAAAATGVIAVTKPQFAAPAAAPSTDAPTQSVRKVTMNINGTMQTAVVDVRSSLWDVMTYQLGMVGANLGCDRAQCGACAVVIDGRAVNSCTVLAARLGRGEKILTIEGLAKGPKVEDLHPVQRAFWQKGGFQCGICTRGFIMSTYALLTKVPTPTEAQVAEALSGNICRCAEYPKVYDSVFAAAAEMKK